MGDKNFKTGVQAAKAPICFLLYSFVIAIANTVYFIVTNIVAVIEIISPSPFRSFLKYVLATT